jgi:hypothetical protein
VNSGLVTANAVGDCEVTVTDGIHGVLVVNVSVVSNTVSITNTPTSISWSFLGDILAIHTNSASSVSNYTVYNSQGIAVFPTLSFIPPANSGLIFSGNTVTSGSVTGSFNVKVKAGNDTLTNTLNVVVLNSDTVYSFDIVQGTLPRIFYRSNVAVPNPLLISVNKCWYVGSTPTFSNYITSPEKMEIINTEDGVILNSNGKLESVKSTHILGGALLSIIYKGGYLHRGISVCLNLTNNWATTLSNGDSYSYCITQAGSDIYYNSNQYFLKGPKKSIYGNYLVIENGSQVFYGSDNLFTGDYDPCSVALVSNGGINLLYSNSINSESYHFQSGGNRIQKSGLGTNPVLQRSSGSCSGGPISPCPVNSDSLSLLNLLIAGGSSSTWLTSSCYVSDGGIISYIFNGNFTGSFVAPDNTMHTMTWAIRKDPFQAQCIYEVYALTVDGSSTYAPMVGSMSFMPPYSGNILYFTQPGGSSCSPSSYYMTK